MIEIAYKTNDGMKIVTYEGRMNMMQPIDSKIISFTLADGSILYVSIINIYYYRVIR